MYSSEYLSKDILDEDFLKVFSPFLSIQWLLGSSRVNARNRFVSAPTIYQKLYTVLVMIITCLVALTAIYMYMKHSKDHSANNLSLVTMFFCLTLFILNTIHVRFINNEANVRFYHKMQKIDRFIKIENRKTINAAYYKINVWTVVIVILMVLLNFTILFLDLLSEPKTIKSLEFSALGLTQIAFTFEITYCSNLMMYFFVRVRFINSLITNHFEHVRKEVIGNGKSSDKSLLMVHPPAAQSDDINSSDTDVYLKLIFDCFHNFQELYKFQVFLFFFNYVAYVIFSFGFGIIALQKTTITYAELLNSLLVGVLGFIQVLFLCYRCDKFYREVEETKQLSVNLLSHYYEGRLWHKAKKMLKTIEKTPRYFSVYDMWKVDASLVLKVCSLVTSLVVIELQLTFP